MPHKAFSALVFLLLALLVLGAPVNATAQDRAAEVEIDMTVLGDIEPSAGDKTTHSSSLTRPIDRPSRPSLTQPTMTRPSIERPVIKTPEIISPAMRPIISKPVEAAPTQVKGAHVPPFRVHDDRPRPSRAEITEPRRVDPDAKIRASKPSANTKPKVVSFPIREKRRSDSTNPSLQLEKTLTDESGLNNMVPQAGTDITEKISAHSPIPNMKPMAVPSKSAQEELQRTRKAVAKTYREIEDDLPLPQHKPAKMKASESFVNASRVYAAKRVKDVSQSGMNMPALPARRVMAEPLTAPPDIGLKLDKSGSRLRGVQSDALASKLVTPDKMQMVESIEKVAALADKIHNSRKNKDQRVVYNTDTLDIDKLQVPELKKANKHDEKGALKHPVFKLPVETPLPQRKPLKARLSSIAIDSGSKPTLQDLGNVEPAAGNASNAGETRNITETLQSKHTVKKTAATQRNTEPSEESAETYANALAIVKLPFQSGQIELDAQGKGKLEDIAVSQLQNNPSLRMQIQAFATADGNKIKNARRGSLSRALAIRNYLMERGIESKRIDVRAMGNQQNNDSVDILILDPNA